MPWSSVGPRLGFIISLPYLNDDLVYKDDFFYLIFKTGIACVDKVEYCITLYLMFRLVLTSCRLNVLVGCSCTILCFLLLWLFFMLRLMTIKDRIKCKMRRAQAQDKLNDRSVDVIILLFSFNA